MNRSLVRKHALLFAWPILSGKEEAWRRFMQEIQEYRQVEYADSRRQLGIRRESVGLARANRTHLAILTIEADEPETLIPRLAASKHPFDRWFTRQVLELHGIDLKRPPVIPWGELVLAWRAHGDGQPD